MPRPVYSTNFIRTNFSIGSATVTYTVPANRVAVIKGITAAQAGVGAMQAGVSTSSAAGPPIVSVFQPAFPAGASGSLGFVNWYGHVVVPAGGVIYAGASGTAGQVCAITVNGYLLTA